MAYYIVEPWGEEMAFLRSGIISSTIANCNRGKHQMPFSPADFLPKYKQPEQEIILPPTKAEIKQAVAQFDAALMR